MEQACLAAPYSRNSPRDVVANNVGRRISACFPRLALPCDPRAGSKREHVDSVNMASAPRAAKRRKPAPGDAAEAFARLLASCSRVEQLCDAAARDLHALQTEIDVCSERCASLQTAWQAEPSSTAAALWKDQLDAKGTSLWNRSIGFKPAHGGEDTDADRSGVFAASTLVWLGDLGAPCRLTQG